MRLQTPIAALVTGLGAMLLAAGVTAPSAAQGTHVGNITGNAAVGKKLYQRSCIGCHGVAGDGNGENAQWIDPKPRDFTAALFKCRSTPTGALPTDQDLFNAMSRGFVTTNMPSWLPLAAQDRVNLVAYIKTFSARWTTEKPGVPITIPAEPGVTAEGILRGRQTFQKLECWKCHGPAGNADGPSASTLTDSKGNPILPYNFAAGWSRFMCGSTNADVYRDFMTGLDGSPMPSFADNLQPAEAWDLVHFLRTLQPMDSPEARIWSVWMATHGNELKPIGPDNGQ